VCHLEAALSCRHRAGERAALVTEQFRLDESGWKGRTIYPNEWLVTPRTSLVHGPGEQLLARASLAKDDDRRVGRSHLLHTSKGDTQGGTVADDVFELTRVPVGGGDVASRRRHCLREIRFGAS
jgi:hypothetical protein